MKVGIIGAGSVGLGVAASLAEAGAQVTLLARGAAVKVLQDEGILITGVTGEHKIPPHIFSVVDAANPGPSALASDILIVATKTYEVAPALDALKPLLQANPALLLLQNGWGTAQEARRIAPPGTPVFSAIVMTGLERRAPGHVNINAHADAIHAGSLFGDDAEKLQPLFDLSQRGFMPFVYEPDIEPVILSKLLYNICLNPLGALRHRTYGDLMRNEETLGIMDRLADEAIRVLKAARGFSRFADGKSYIRGELVPKWLEKVGAHRSSMLQDLEAGRKTEIDYLNGAVCAMGRESSIATPDNDAIVRQIHATETGANRKATG